MNVRWMAALFAALGVAALANLHVGGAASATSAGPDGKALFATKCAACHQATGLGIGPFPPLAANPDVTGADTAGLIATVLNGRSGPISVNGRSYGGAMPAWRGQLTNAQIATVLSYIRSAWTNKAAIVSEAQVAAAAAPMALSGSALFSTKCSTCHQASAQGTAIYPPLAANPDLDAADPKGVIATVVNGRTGPLVVNGKTYDAKMPTWKGTLSNADIAAVVSFVRSSWGNTGSAVSEQQVAAAGASVSTAIGASIFSKNCASCHQASGQGGGGGTFPALAGNADVERADPTGILKTIAHGNGLMPAWKGQLSAGDIAAVVTYIRSSWGNKAPAVTESDVTAIK